MHEKNGKVLGSQNVSTSYTTQRKEVLDGKCDFEISFAKEGLPSGTVFELRDRSKEILHRFNADEKDVRRVNLNCGDLIGAYGETATIDGWFSQVTPLSRLDLPALISHSTQITVSLEDDDSLFVTV